MGKTILDEISDKAKERVRKLKLIRPLEDIKKEAAKLDSNTGFPYEKALRGDDITFICEVKKASPSKGIIAEDFPYTEIAKEYEQAGAAAISVLTEPDYFKGNDKYLMDIRQQVSIPLLRKDFTVDEYQIYEAKIIGADAVLLIVSILSENQLKSYIKIAHTLGLSALVETHDEHEIVRAIEAGARIIGVNNRNLKDFTVDIKNSVRLRKYVPENIIFISESGIKTPEDIQVLKNNKTDAVLIGETFMKSPDKKQMLNNLSGGGKSADNSSPWKIKICGLSREEDIRYANEAKPDYIGFVFAKSRRKITKDKARILKRKLDTKILAVGVFVDEAPREIAQLLNEDIIDMAQLHGNEDNEYIRKLKELSNKKIIKAFGIKCEEDIKAANESSADYLLLDAYSGDKMGGTGEVFDWSLIGELNKPFFLAGGISIENVENAVRTVNPYCIDLSSSVETRGVKDRGKIISIVKKIKSLG